MIKVLLLLLLFIPTAFAVDLTTGGPQKPSVLYFQDYLDAAGKSCDGVTNVATELNNFTRDLINVATASDYTMKGVLPNGICYITDTWFVSSDDSTNTFRTFYIEGAGKGYDPASDEQVGTVIDCSDDLMETEPCLAIDSNRHFVLKNFGVFGPNSTPITVSEPDQDRSVYIEAGVRDTRYSPQTCICVDCTTGAVPADGGFPGVSYRTGVSTVPSGGKFDGMFIRNCNVGVGFGLSGNHLNNDIYEFISVGLAGHVTGISHGHSQTRGHNFFGGVIGSTHTAAEGLRHGDQQGSPIAFFGTTLGPLYRVFSYGNAFGASMVLKDVHVEQTKMLGNWGVADSQGKNKGYFSGVLKLGNTTYTDRLPICILETHSDWTFENAGISSVETTDPFDHAINVCATGPSDIILDNVSFGEAGNIDNPPLVFFRHDQGAAQMTKMRSVYMDINGNTNLHLDDEGSMWQTVISGASGGRVYHTYNQKFIHREQQTYALQGGDNNYYEAVTIDSTTVSVSTASNNITFSIDRSGGDEPDVLQVGDIIPWQTASGYNGTTTQFVVPGCEISSITYDGVNTEDDVTCDMLWEDAAYDTGYAPSTVISIRRPWVAVPPTTEGVTCDLTSGDYIATGCVNNDNVRVGDWLENDVRGIRTNSRVWAVDNHYVAVDYDGGTGTANNGEIATCTGGETIIWDNVGAGATGTLDYIVIGGTDPIDNDSCTGDVSGAVRVMNEPTAFPAANTDSIGIKTDGAGFEVTVTDAPIQNTALIHINDGHGHCGKATLSSGTANVINPRRILSSEGYVVELTGELSGAPTEYFSVDSVDSIDFTINSSNTSSTATVHYCVRNLGVN